MKRQRGNLGFSLVEVMVASAILAIIVGSTMTFLTGTESKNTFSGQIQKHNACIGEASKIIANIKEKGQSRYRAHYPANRLNAGLYTYTANGNVDQMNRSTREYGLNVTERWADPIYVPSFIVGSPWMIHPQRLIMGYMNTLQTLYNSDPLGYCGATGSNANTIIVEAPTATILNTTTSAASSSLRIQVYSLTAGGAPSCPPRVDIRPANAEESNVDARTRHPKQETKLGNLPFLNHPNTMALRVFGNPVVPPVTSSLGFIVTAMVSYDDRNGDRRTCKVQEKFQYNAQPENTMTLEFEDVQPDPINDQDIPEYINSTIITTNVSNPPRFKSLPDADYTSIALPNTAADTPIYRGCDHAGVPSDTRSVSFRMTRTREGSIHMCRDLSQVRASQQFNVTADWRHALPTDISHFPTGTGGYTGFYFRTQLPMRNTFYSTELLRHAYWAGKELTTTDTNLFATGLYYPPGGYYCLGLAGCGGGASGTSTLEMIDRAMPFFPRATYNPGGALNVEYREYAEATGNYRYYIPSDHNAGTDTGVAWRPCETITNVCGNGIVTQSRFRLGNSTVTNRDAYQMQISSLPGGCEVHIQIAEVDAGYNIKTAEFKEYIQERVPGNRLCRNSDLGNALFQEFNPMGVDTWFFACSTSYADTAAAPLCADGVTGDCCMNYPIFPTSRPFVDPP